LVKGGRVEGGRKGVKKDSLRQGKNFWEKISASYRDCLYEGRSACIIRGKVLVSGSHLVKSSTLDAMVVPRTNQRVQKKKVRNFAFSHTLIGRDPGPGKGRAWGGPKEKTVYKETNLKEHVGCFYG